MFVERTAWTDERLDDLAQRMDAGFERVDRDIRDLRTEMREEFGDVRAEMRDGFSSVRGEMREEFGAMRAMIWRFGGAMIVTFAGALAAFSLRGA